MSTRHLIELFLPLRDNHGRPFGPETRMQVRDELAERFGGVTVFSRAPAEGVWTEQGGAARDDLVVFEVMADELDRTWWGDYRQELEARFRQAQIVVRAQTIEVL
jgi:hypothetical protein